MDSDLQSLWITLQLAGATTLLLLCLGTPLAWFLGRSQHPVRYLLEPLVALPIVLPPTVMGFYLLLAFSPDTWLGQSWQTLTGNTLAFSFEALVIGSVLYSLPFYVQPVQLAFASLPKGLLEAAATLGASPVDRFFSLILPLSKSGFIAGTCLAFAHTLGEFGIVLMIGGNIPGETRVLSIALYDHVEAMQYGQANRLAAGLLIFSFLLLFALYALNRPARNPGPGTQ
ncbi:MAG: molybdate ABC transporter permease subunit [Pseudomonadales bacterium]|nr:molybdate ABC transporter permease subunit [Pseudomonadales bacterium]